MNDLAILNDTFRKSWKDVVFTSNVLTRVQHHLALAQEIQDFSEFNEDNDPYEEHDFGSLELEGEHILWKIDYYDQSLSY